MRHDQTTFGHILGSKEMDEHSQAWEAPGMAIAQAVTQRSTLEAVTGSSGYLLGSSLPTRQRPIGVNRRDDGLCVTEPICGMPEMKMQTTMLKSRLEICS